MMAVHDFRQAEFRSRVTATILEMLADLPETHRNTFLLNHYRGYQPKQIAEILKCSPAEIEAALNAINSILYEKTQGLLIEGTASKSDESARRHDQAMRQVADCGK